MKAVRNSAWLLEMHVNVGTEDIWVSGEHFLATGDLFLLLSVAEDKGSHLWRPVGTGGLNTLQSHTLQWVLLVLSVYEQQYTEHSKAIFKVIHMTYIWNVNVVIARLCNDGHPYTPPTYIHYLSKMFGYSCSY